jgi:hypothetical protein
MTGLGDGKLVENITLNLSVLIRSTKHDLIIKLISQMGWKPQYESIKPN